MSDDDGTLGGDVYPTKPNDPKDETAMLLKHGSKDNAIMHWANRQTTAEDEWEFKIVIRWIQEQWEEHNKQWE